MQDRNFCMICGNVDFPSTKTSGSFVGELCLWIIFIFIALASSILVLIVPLIYTLARAFSTKKACSKCNAIHIIPVDSPVAVAKMNELGINKPEKDYQ
jgi:hypothetical protein